MPSDGRSLLDAAITAATHAGNTVGQWHDCFAVATIAALRAALPWDLPAVRLESVAGAAYHVWFGEHASPRWGEAVISKQTWRDAALAAYRADPIMRELYPERFAVSDDGGEESAA